MTRPMGTLDDLRATLDGHADALTDTDAAARGGAVRARVARVRRRRRTTLASGLAAVVVAAGIGVAAIPGHDREPAQPTQFGGDPERIFTGHEGSQRLIRAWTNDGGASIGGTFTTTGRTVERVFCTTKTPKAMYDIILDGKLRDSGQCNESDPWVAESDLTELKPGTHTITMRTVGTHGRTQDVGARFGVAVYDGSDVVRISGYPFDRVSEVDGVLATPRKAREGRFTPRTTTWLFLMADRTTASLKVINPAGRDIGMSDVGPGSTVGWARLTAGRTYTVRVVYAKDGPGGDATVIAYTPVS